jgi:DNA invertase Pin-like site-specific DNA recombinase
MAKDPGRTPAKASNFIQHLEALARERPGLTAVVYCRVSERFQHHTGNLDDQQAAVLRELARLGIPVIAVYPSVESGWQLADCPERQRLTDAAEHAREVGAVLVAETLSRFIRAVNWTTQNQDAVPVQEEYEQLLAITGGVTLATIFHPDTPPRVERSHQTRRGQRAKGRKGGRPAGKKRKQKANWPMPVKLEANRLRRQGISIGRIAKRLGVPKPTVQYWLRPTV